MLRASSHGMERLTAIRASSGLSAGRVVRQTRACSASTTRPHAGSARNAPSAATLRAWAGLIGDGLDREASGPLSTPPALPHADVGRLDMLPEPRQIEQTLGLGSLELVPNGLQLRRIGSQT